MANKVIPETDPTQTENPLADKQKNLDSQPQNEHNQLLILQPPITNMGARIVDTPVQVKAMYSFPFVASLTREQILEMNDSCFEVIQVTDQPLGNMLQYQIINDAFKIGRWRQGIPNALFLINQQQMLKKMTPLFDPIIQETNGHLSSISSMFNYGKELSLSIPTMKTYHKQQLEYYEKEIVDLKHQLSLRLGDTKEDDTKKKIIWAKMQKTLNMTTIEIHIPKIEFYVNEYFSTYSNQVNNMHHDKFLGLTDFVSEQMNWRQTAIDLINQSEIALNDISNLTEILGNQLAQHLLRGIETFNRGKMVLVQAAGFKSEFQLLQKFIALLDEILAVQAARVPYSDMRDDLIKWNNQNFQNKNLWKSNYNKALINQKNHLLQIITQKQIQIQQYNIQKLYSIARQLESENAMMRQQVGMITNAEAALSKEEGIAALANPKFIGNCMNLGHDIARVVHGDYAHIGHLMSDCFKVAIPIVKCIRHYCKTKKPVDKNMDADEKEMQQEVDKIEDLEPGQPIPQEAMQFINEAEFNRNKAEAKELINQMSSMIADDIANCKREYDAAQIKYKDSQAVVTTMEEMNKSLENLSNLRDNNDIFRQGFKSFNDQVRLTVEQNNAKKLQFYFFCSQLDLTKIPLQFNQFFLSLRDCLNIETPGCLSCVSCTKAAPKAFETRKMTENQVKRKLCKIIRKRMQIPKNDINVSYDQRLLNLTFPDLVVFYQSKKLWSVFKNACINMQFQTFKSFDFNTSQPVGMKTKNLNIHFKMNQIFRMLITNLAMKVYPQ